MEEWEGEFLIAIGDDVPPREVVVIVEVVEVVEIEVEGV
jgi:hypothetical protein